jgi:hypothetical protein
MEVSEAVSAHRSAAEIAGALMNKSAMDRAGFHGSIEADDCPVRGQLAVSGFFCRPAEAHAVR